MLLEHGNAVPVEGQVAGRGETGDPAPTTATVLPDGSEKRRQHAGIGSLLSSAAERFEKQIATGSPSPSQP